MNKYRVRLEELRYVTVEVEANDEDEAMDKAYFAYREQFPEFEDNKYILDDVRTDIVVDYDPCYDNKYDYLPDSLFQDYWNDED